MESKLIHSKPDETQVQKPNLTGIPTQMKLDFERRSGLSFDDVRVHYNSDKPARLGALAYTQGNQIHVGPGQERHLPHELGHIIQQKAGPIPVTRKVRGMPINDDPTLETQADRFARQPERVPVLNGSRDHNTIQRYTPEEEAFIQEYMGQLTRRLQEKNWQLSYEECRRLLVQLYHNGTPWIEGHHAVLNKRVYPGRSNILFVQKKTPAGNGGHMRTSAEGVHYELEILEYSGPPQPAAYAGVFELGGTPVAHTPRKSLQRVMGGSASKSTGKPGAEYLHILAHHLGGKETPDNLVAGAHALNTAMIPVENAVNSIKKSEYPVTYAVKMIPRSVASYIEEVEITISVINNQSQQHTWSFHFSVSNYPKNSTDYMLNEENYRSFMSQLNRWKKDVLIFLSGEEGS